MTEVANIPARWDVFFFDIPQVKLLFTILGYPYSHVGYPYSHVGWDIHFGCLQCFLDICRGDQSSHVQRRLSKVPVALRAARVEIQEKADRNHRSDPRFGWRLHQKAVDAMWVMWQKASKRFKKAKILQRKSISCTSWTRGSSSSSGITLGLLHPNCLRWHFQVVNSCLL